MRKLTISVEEAARLLGISRGLAYDLARRGELPGAVRLGEKRIVVSRAALEAHLAGGPTMAARQSSLSI
jgi:excisionase family DNA binding protein